MRGWCGVVTAVAGPSGELREPAASEQLTVVEYERLAYKIAAGFFHPSLTEDDLKQEALLGIVLAYRSFNADAGAWWPFVMLCIRRQVITAVKAAGRAKHQILTEAWRSAYSEEDGGEVAILELVPDTVADVHDRIVVRDDLARAIRVLGCLSPLEREAVVNRANGVSCWTNSAAYKRTDNALQRARRKLAAAA